MRDIALERNKCSVERAIVLFLYYWFALSSLSIFNGSTVLKSSLFDDSHKIQRTKKFVFARHTTNEANARAPQAFASFYTLSLPTYCVVTFAKSIIRIDCSNNYRATSDRETEDKDETNRLSPSSSSWYCYSLECVRVCFCSDYAWTLSMAERIRKLENKCETILIHAYLSNALKINIT